MVLNQALIELTYELPSRAEGCQGRSPTEAYPKHLQPSHPFRPEQELAHFDLHRVDAYLAKQVRSASVVTITITALDGQMPSEKS